MSVLVSTSEKLLSLRRLLAAANGGAASPRPSQRVTSAAGDGDSQSGPLWSLASGTIQEWVATTAGSGALELAIWNARQSLQGQSITAGGRWLVVDLPLCPVALRERGIDLERLVSVPIQEPNDLLWTVEQGLRSRGVDLVICRVGRLPPVAFRRWKLAAEVGGTRCLVLRGIEALRESGWADLRVQVSPQRSSHWGARRMQVETLKVRNGLPGEVIEVELDRETDRLRVVSVLASSAATPRAAGAEKACCGAAHLSGESVAARSSGKPTSSAAGSATGNAAG